MECMTCDGVYDLRWSALVVIVSADQLTDASFAFCVGEQSDRPWVNPATTERVLQYSERHLPVVIRWSTHSSNYRCSHTLYHPQGDQEELKQRDHLICMLTESTCSLSLSLSHTHTHTPRCKHCFQHRRGPPQTYHHVEQVRWRRQRHIAVIPPNSWQGTSGLH